MADHEAHRDAHLLYELRALPTAATVLHVGTHPDDEETGLLTYLARGRGVRAVYWSATRGEGGQNRSGTEKHEALGVLRTWESLSACQINGAEPLYGPFYDFGFSKTAEDALARWGRDAVIREIVRAIRMVMPQVVISRWSGGPTDGHGQHQAIGIATREAFAAAGDPDRYPDLRDSGLVAWQPLKLYHSMAGDWQPGEDEDFGSRNEDYERQGLLRLNTGVYDPVAGRSYQEQAAIAWNRHRSQALSFLPEWRDFCLYYGLVESLVPTEESEQDFFDGLDPGLAGMAGHTGGGSQLRDLLLQAQHAAELAAGDFHPDGRDKTAGYLLEGLASLRAALELAASQDPAAGDPAAVRTWLPYKVRAFEKAIARLLGIDVECLVERRHATPGEAVRVAVRVRHKLGPTIDGATLGLRVPQGWSCVRLDEAAHEREHGSSADVDEALFAVTVPPTAPYSTPYWFRQPRSAYAYAWPQDAPLGLPLDEPLISASCEVALGHHRITVTAPGVLREGFPGGYRELPLAVLPAIAVEPGQRRELLAADASTQRLVLQATARCQRRGGAEGTLTIEAPPGWDVRPPTVPLSFARDGDMESFSFQVHLPGDARGAYQLRYWVATGETRDSVVLEPVHQLAPGLPGPATEATCVAEVFIARPATVSIHVVDARFVRTLRYGYIQGADEQVVDALAAFDLDLDVLGDDDLAYADLSVYNTLVVGPNAYLLRPALRKNAARLLEYVARGGTLVVQFQGYGYDSGGFAPYPLRYTQPHDRVTRPDAPVTLLDPEHPVLRSPNPIDASDFHGWVHDRGLYFSGTWDRRYIPLLSSADPGEKPKDGGLLLASVGRGTYVYTGYSFFRQIPAGVNGAVKLFANIVGLSEARIRDRLARVRTVPLFAGLPEAELYEIARLVSEEWFDDGTVLSRQGDRGQDLYLVLQGAIEVVKEDGDQWRVVYTAETGDPIGELATLADLPRSASLRARGATKVLMMRGEDFRRLVTEHRDVSQQIIRILATRLAQQNPAQGWPSD